MENSIPSVESNESINIKKPSRTRLVFIFIIMFFSFYSINLVGKFLLVEFLFFTVFLFHILEGKISSTTKRLQPFVGLLILALISQIFVDMTMGNLLTSALKGFSLILFTLTNLYGIAWLTKFRSLEIRMALLGYSLGGLAGFFLQPSTYARSEIWKFGVGYPLTLTVMVLISMQFLVRYKFLQVVLLVLLSVFSLIFGARSLALFTLLPLFFLEFSKSKKHLNRSRNFRAALAISIVIFAFSAVYANLAENGDLGVKAQSKYLLQTSSGGNILINSRSELIFAAKGIADSPIFGHGSYAMMSPELRLEIQNFLDRVNIHYDMTPLNRIYGDRIPVHSMLLQWWLWFGVLGMLFPLRLGFLYVNSLKIRNREPVFYYLALSGIWNLLFSPYGEGYRILIPMTVVMLLGLEKSQQLERISDD